MTVIVISFEYGNDIETSSRAYGARTESQWDL